MKKFGVREWPIRDKMKELVAEDRLLRSKMSFEEIEGKIVAHIERDTRAAFEAFLRRLLMQVRYAIRESAQR